MKAKVITATALLQFLTILVSAQVSEQDIKNRINLLYETDAQTAQPVLMQYYTNEIFSDAIRLFKKDTIKAINFLKSYSDSKFDDNAIDQKQLVATAFSQINQNIRNYQVAYGDFLKLIKVKNDEIEINPAEFYKIYEYSNNWVFENLTAAINDYSDKFNINIYLELKRSTLDVNKKLIDGFEKGTPEAIESMFRHAGKIIDQQITNELNGKKQQFVIVRDRINKILVDNRDSLQSLIFKANELVSQADYTLYNIEQMIQTSIEKYNVDYVALYLAKIKESNKEEFEKIARFDKEALKKFLKDISDGLIKRFSDEIKNEKANIIQVQEEYKQKLIKSKENVNQFIQKTRGQVVEQITNLEEEYRKMISVLPKVSESIDWFNQSLHDYSAKLKDEVQKFSDKYLKDPLRKADAALFLASFFVDTKEVDKFLTDARGSLKAGANEFDIAFKNEKEKLIGYKKSISENIQGYLNTADIVLNSLNLLGIGNSKTLKTLSTGLKIAQGVVNAFSAFASGNVFGAVTGVLGMFGLGGPDVAEQRHQQVMAALERIDSKLDVINEKLDTIISLQIKTLQLQKATLDEILSFRDVAIKEFDKLNRKLDLINTNVNFLIVREYLKELTGVVGFCSKLNLQKNFDQISYANLSTNYNSIKADKWKDFFNVFDRHPFLLTDGASSGTIDKLYLNSVYNGINDLSDEQKGGLMQLDSFYLALIKKANGTITNLFPSAGNGKLISTLLSPSFNYEELRYKLEQANISNGLNQPELDNRHISSYIAPNVAAKNAEIILMFHPIIALTDRNYEIIKPDVNYFRNINANQLNAKNQLTQALTIVEASIIEQNLLSGDFLLESMYLQYQKLLANLSKADSAIARENNELLNNDFGGMLYDNFIHYYIQRCFDESKKNDSKTVLTLLGYSSAYASKDSLLMNTKTVKFPFSLIYIDSTKAKQLLQENKIPVDTGWNVRVEERYHHLPPPSDFELSEDFRLSHSQYIVDLISYRDKLINAIEAYNITSETDEVQNKALNNIYLQSTFNNRQYYRKKSIDKLEH